MAVAAVPRYLGTDYSAASPGLRFGIYLPLWGTDRRSSELLWSTHDVNYRVAGQQREERAFNDENKGTSLRQAAALTRGDLDLMRALSQRQAALAAPGIAAGHVFATDSKAVAPFTTGLGNEHPLENGFAFLNPYGLPYLPGSGVKGVLRAAARELCSGEWGDNKGWIEDAIPALFGLQTDDGATTHQRGALSFWDVIPQLPGDRLHVDVMTPHQSHYLQGKEAPHHSGQPNPIAFLTVPPGTAFAFHVACDVPFLRRIGALWAQDGRWKQLLEAAFEHAFTWLGFGAKTAVGYGAMSHDHDVRRRRERQVEALQAEARAKAAQAARQQELERMDPAEREVQRFFDARADKNQRERPVLFNALKKGEWSGEVKVAAARRVEALMRAEGAWKETSTKKNPEKDNHYQETLLVKKWLAAD